MLQKVGLFEVAKVTWAFFDSTAFQSLAIIASILVAYWGLGSFQKQHLWTKKAELAEELLIAVSEFRQAMERVRNPVSFGGEGSSRTKGDNETVEQGNLLDHLYTTLERFNNEAPLFERLRLADVRARLRFGNKVSTALDQLADCHRRVVVAARMRFRIEGRVGNGPQTPQQIEKMQQRERLIWSVPEEDEIGPQIDAAVALLNRNLSEYISEGDK